MSRNYKQNLTTAQFAVLMAPILKRIADNVLASTTLNATTNNISGTQVFENYEGTNYTIGVSANFDPNSISPFAVTSVLSINVILDLNHTHAASRLVFAAKGKIDDFNNSIVVPTCGFEGNLDPIYVGRFNQLVQLMITNNFTWSDATQTMLIPFNAINALPNRNFG